MSLRKEVDFVTLKIKTGENSRKNNRKPSQKKKNKKEEQEENSGSLKTDKIHR